MNDVCLAGPQPPPVSKTPVIYTVPASKTPVFDTHAIMSTQVANPPKFLLVACCYQEGLNARGRCDLPFARSSSSAEAISSAEPYRSRAARSALTAASTRLLRISVAELSENLDASSLSLLTRPGPLCASEMAHPRGWTFRLNPQFICFRPHLLGRFRCEANTIVDPLARPHRRPTGGAMHPQASWSLVFLLRRFWF